MTCIAAAQPGDSFADTVRPRHLFYLSLERLRPASAADTHVRGMLAGFERLGWHNTLFAEVGNDQKRPGLLRQFYRYFRLQAAMAVKLRSADVVYVRQHFASAPIVVFAHLRGKPIVLELNGLPEDSITTYPFLGHFKRWISWSYRIQFSRASHVLPVTQGLAELYAATSRHEMAALWQAKLAALPPEQAPLPRLAK